MKTTARKLVRDELIGRNATIITAANKSQEGMKGTIVDETKFTLVIQTARGKKRVFKEAITLQIPYKGSTFTIKGSVLKGRPEERIKQR